MTDHGSPPPAPPPPPPPPGTGAQPPGYWLASDGKWYPRAAPPAPVGRTNGFAIASLVLGILWFYWVGSLLAVVFGHIAIRQIAGSEGREEGRGMAVAGLVLGYIGVVLGGLAIAAIIAITALGSTVEPEPFTPGGGFGGEPLLGEREQFLLQEDCRQGEMWACDELYHGTEMDSALEEFGATCGNRAPDWQYAGRCEEQFG